MIFASCGSKHDADCSASFQPLNLPFVNVSFNIPSYKTVDSVTYGDLTHLKHYKIESIDSSFSMPVFIDNHEKDSEKSIDLNRIAEVQKAEVESGQNTKKLIKEEFKDIGTTRVRYVKYLVEQDMKKFYHGRIFFYRKKILVACWLIEDYRGEPTDIASSVDCVFEHIQVH